MDEICWGCFGASFGDCQDCPTRTRYETELTIDMKDVYKEEENGKEEEVL